MAKNTKSTESVVSPQTERLILNVGMKSAMGLAAAGIVSVLAFRGAGPRAFVAGLGMGSGLGYAWCQNDLFLKDNKAISLPLSMQQEFDKYWQNAAQMVPDFAKFK
jgi:hypothetical protein